MLVEQRLPHKPSPAHQTLVRLLVRMHEPVRVAIVAAVERLAAHLAQERLLPRMDAPVFLEMLGIDERGLADVALERAFAGVDRFYVIIEKSGIE